MTNVETQAYQSQKRLQIFYGIILLFLAGLLLYISQTQDILPNFSLVAVILLAIAGGYKFFVGFRMKISSL